MRLDVPAKRNDSLWCVFLGQIGVRGVRPVPLTQNGTLIIYPLLPAYRQ